MLLSNIKDADVQSVLDEIEAANQESAKTEMVPPKRAVADLATISGVVAALDEDATEKVLNDPEVRLQVFAAMYVFGLFHSTTDERFPFATVNEIEKAVNDGLVGEHRVIPGTKRCIALLKGEGAQKEYRKGNAELKGKKAPTEKWDSIDALVRRNTSGIVLVIRKAAKAANKRVRDEKAAEQKVETPEQKKKPVEKPKAKRKAPPKKKKTEEAPVV